MEMSSDFVMPPSSSKRTRMNYTQYANGAVHFISEQEYNQLPNIKGFWKLNAKQNFNNDCLKTNLVLDWVEGTHEGVEGVFVQMNPGITILQKAGSPNPRTFQRVDRDNVRQLTELSD